MQIRHCFPRRGGPRCLFKRCLKRAAKARSIRRVAELAGNRTTQFLAKKASAASSETSHLPRPGVFPPHRHAVAVDDEARQRPGAAGAGRRRVGRGPPDEQVRPAASQLGTAARHVGRRNPHRVRLVSRRPVVRTLVYGRHVDSEPDPVGRAGFLAGRHQCPDRCQQPIKLTLTGTECRSDIGK